MNADSPHHGLSIMLRTLKLPTFAAMHEQVALQGDRDGWTLGQSLRHLCELEIEARRQRKIERLLKAAELPPDKTLATLDLKRWPTKVQRQIPPLCNGDFLGRAENLLVFGLPCRGQEPSVRRNRIRAGAWRPVRSLHLDSDARAASLACQARPGARA